MPALRTSLRTLPPNRPTNPPLLPRTRTQRPPLARRNPPRQTSPSRTIAASQSRTARRPTVKSCSTLDVETERFWCWRGHFFGRLWFEQSRAVEDQPVEAEEGEAELCCGQVGVAGWAEGEAVEEEYGVSVRECSMMVCLDEETVDLISMIPNNAITISYEERKCAFPWSICCLCAG